MFTSLEFGIPILAPISGGEILGWIKLDDNFFENPKIDALSSEAQLLYLWALCYSSRQMSNGFVPAKRVDAIEQRPLVREIVAIRRWASVKLDGIEGYEIHDYLKHQNSKANIEEVREKNRKKLSLYRASKREAEIAGLRVTVGVTNDVTELHPVDVTTPEDEDEIENQFEKFWNLYPRKDGKKGAQVSFEKALKISSLDAILEGVTRYIRFLKTATQDTAMPATWLNGERWNDQNSSPASAWNSATPDVPHKRVVDSKTLEPYCESCGQTWPCNAEQRIGSAEF